jgi:SET domain-containing protein
MGCFATRTFPKLRKIADFAGERTSRRETKKRTHGKQIIRCVGIDSYWSIDATRIGNPTAYVNHSCSPNAFIKVNSGGRGRVEFYALRDVLSGEEITVDYEFSQHPDDYRCRCGAPNCRGTINKVQPKSATRAAAAPSRLVPTT